MASRNRAAPRVLCTLTQLEEAYEFTRTHLPNDIESLPLVTQIVTRAASVKKPVLRVVASTQSGSIRHLDVVVENEANGTFIHGLTRIDFELSSDIKRLSQVAVNLVELSTEKRAIAILQDKSFSMQGPSDVSATKAIATFIASVPNSIKLRPWRFADSLQPGCPWTIDKELLQLATRPLAPNGGTTLYKSLQEVIQDLLTRHEKRTIILFTDGADSTKQDTSEQVIQSACSANIRVIAVGLKTDTTSETFLKAIANRTGGEFLRAEDSSKLDACFESIRKSILQPAYRIVAIQDTSSKMPLTLTVGEATIEISAP